MAIIKAERLIIDPNTIRVTYDDRPEAYVPADPSNSDYAQVLLWVEFENGVIEDEVYPLEQRQQMKVWELTNIRNEKFQANITVAGDTFYADDASVNLINHALCSQERDIQYEVDGVLKQVFPVDWILANNTVKTLTYDELKAVNAAYARRREINYKVYGAYYLQIMTSPNPENIDVTQGWEA